ncbi:MAG TPA: GspH/FimT family pseudopilin [Burkholderiales bacterium]|jgi:type IV fimbrial biogenesis protein FimT|nr:GspH/FimT family pseudopilin [Burkholderiales bacterium]
MSLLRSVTTATRLPRAARGYTLAEVLMVVAILSVLLAAGVPQLADFSRQQRVKTASFELFSTLVHARSEAITRNGQVTVTPTGGAWINGWTVTGPGGTVIRRQEAVPAIAITGPDAVVFAESGRLNAATRPQFALTTTGANVVHRCIRVDLSGRPVSKAASC